MVTAHFLCCSGFFAAKPPHLMAALRALPTAPDRISVMYAIMTVTGADSTGIIAAVTTTLADLNVNVIDVSQTIMGDYFTMILRVEFNAESVSIQTIQERMRPVAEEKQQSIRIQSEDLFTAMNEI